MQKHTGAPWRIRGNEIGKRIESDTQSHGMLALIATVDMYDFPEEAEANKLLICAAPALLEALEDAIKTVEFERHPFRAWHDKARAAIAAARGTV
jgi:hypothetical protein